MQDVDISVLLCIDGYAAQQVAGPTFVARNSRTRPPDSCHDFAGLDRKGDDLRREVLQLTPAFAWIDFGYVLQGDFLCSLGLYSGGVAAARGGSPKPASHQGGATGGDIGVRTEIR